MRAKDETKGQPRAVLCRFAAEAAGRPIGVMDAFIAATANVHALKLVTHNESDFDLAVDQIVNPWSC